MCHAIQATTHPLYRNTLILHAIKSYPRKRVERFFTALPLSYSAMNGGNRIRTGDLSIRFEVTLPGASDMDVLFFKEYRVKLVTLEVHNGKGHIRGKWWKGTVPLYHWAILPWTAEAGFEPATGRLTVEVTLSGASDMWVSTLCGALFLCWTYLLMDGMTSTGRKYGELLII